MADGFSAPFQVTWGDLDINGHMANRAYLDYTTQTRFLYLAGRGFTPVDFRRHRVGPVIFKDRVSYLKELRFMDRFCIDFAAELLREDGARFRVRNRFYRGDDLCAEVDSDAAWIDLETRKVAPPPPVLDAAMRTAPPLAD